MTPSGSKTAITVSSDDLDVQLEQIFASPGFRSSNRLKRFLRFVVDQTVAGKSEQIKGYTIGIEVFDRPSDFDPQTDTIVRVEASRLRRALSQYYLGAGRDDPIKIEIPKGTYVPVLSGKAKPDEPTSINRAGEPAPVAPDKPSIAVLSFVNMSGDPEQEYFADGIAEDVITALSRFRSLFVIARNSTFTYKGAAVDVMQVARDLGVRYVVEGSVRKAANKVRVTAQLIDGTTGNHVWAERYDRVLDDIFAIQDEMTETIVGSIASEVGANERERAWSKPPANLDAWELYQRGLWHLYKTTKEDNKKARDLFHEAVERDPKFALAHAGIAYTCSNDVQYIYGYDPAERLEQGIAAGEHAVDLDDKDGFAHYTLGRVLHLAGQSERAIAELEKAVAHNPNFAHGHYGLGLALNRFGRAADGILMLDRAMRLSPQDPILWAMQAARASCCNNLENYEEAEEWVRKSANARPDLIWPHFLLAVALAGQDRLDEARVAVEAARHVQPDLSPSVVSRLLPHYHPKYYQRIVGLLAKAGLPE